MRAWRRVVPNSLIVPSPAGRGYTVISPVSPELITEGDTLEEAPANVRDAFDAVAELSCGQGRPLRAAITLPAAVRQPGLDSADIEKA